MNTVGFARWRFSLTNVSVEVVVDGCISRLCHGLDSLITGGSKDQVTIHLH